MDPSPDPPRERAPHSRAIYFWIAIGVFFGVLLVARLVDPPDPDPVRAAEVLDD